MSKALPLDITMDCDKCKKALCDRIQQEFKDRLLKREVRIWKYTAHDILEHVIKEELEK